ncbi:hypothetical protein [Yoonia sp. 2307UL14-13]|uniref:hypothetical protein n=1 Tax=Yoonia sp. 2307UL14-13 TaxID=3126506 RepID=UPI0030A5BF23
MPVTFLLGGKGRRLFSALAGESDNAKNLDFERGGIPAPENCRRFFGEMIDQSAVADVYVSLNFANPHWVIQLTKMRVENACFRVKMRPDLRLTHQSLALPAEHSS